MGARRRENASAIHESAGTLKLQGGGAWNAIASSEGETHAIDLDDGSRIALEPGARLEPLDNTDRSVVVLLGRGRAVFDVRPGGPRRWFVEAGLATVEVVGTRFAVSRSSERVVIEVERGIVLVRGEHVADHVRRLVGGERLEIDGTSRALPIASPALATPPSSRGAPPAPPSEVPSWHRFAQQGNYEQAYESLGVDGVTLRSKTADVEQLLELADVARFSGHAFEAVAPLERVVAEYGRDPRGPLAAFTLGRVHLDSLNDPAAAAQDFETAIALGLPEALLEDAYLRLIDARARAGDRHGAHEAWAEYHERFPNSTRRWDADQWRR